MVENLTYAFLVICYFVAGMNYNIRKFIVGEKIGRKKPFVLGVDCKRKTG